MEEVNNEDGTWTWSFNDKDDLAGDTLNVGDDLLGDLINLLLAGQN